jgi:DNA-binding transcriptional LysR family regulator
MLDLRRLAVFREVVRHGSFSAAADHLGYSQPAVSHHVSRLELEVGAALLHRRPRGLELTRLGHEVLRHADAILDLVHSAEAELRDAVSADPDLIRLGGFQTSTEAVIRVALERFWRDYPLTRVSLLEADPVDHIDGLRSGRLDLAIVFDSSEGAIAVDDRIAIERLHDDPMLVALPAGHSLAGAEAVRLGDLRDARWLEGAGPDTASALVLLRACEPLGFEPDIVFSCGNYHAVQELVRHGMGVALVPELAAIMLHPGVVVRPLVEPAPARRIGVAMLRTRHVPAVYSGMQRALREAFSAYRDARASVVSPAS